MKEEILQWLLVQEQCLINQNKNQTKIDIFNNMVLIDLWSILILQNNLNNWENIILTLFNWLKWELVFPKINQKTNKNYNLKKL